MRGVRLNHVSVHADDLEASAAFYQRLLGLEALPTPEFGYPVRWFRLGEHQVHLFSRPGPAPANHHFAIDVDDIQAVWIMAAEMGIFDSERGPAVRRLPDGSAQMYVRDPAGNLLELDAPDADRLDTAVVGQLERVPGPPEARLYLDR